MNQNDRPLSPHLHIYRPQITSILSITHRLTGIGLFWGLFFLVSWLGAVAFGAETYARFCSFFQGGIGEMSRGFFLFCFYYHVMNGVRHLLWDMGYGLSLKIVKGTGWGVVVMSALFTLLTRGFMG